MKRKKAFTAKYHLLSECRKSVNNSGSGVTAPNQQQDQSGASSTAESEPNQQTGSEYCSWRHWEQQQNQQGRKQLGSPWACLVGRPVGNWSSSSAIIHGQDTKKLQNHRSEHGSPPTATQGVQTWTYPQDTPIADPTQPCSLPDTSPRFIPNTNLLWIVFPIERRTRASHSFLYKLKEDTSTAQAPIQNPVEVGRGQV